MKARGRGRERTTGPSLAAESTPSFCVARAQPIGCLNNILGLWMKWIVREQDRSSLIHHPQLVVCRVYQTDRCACLQCSLTKRASGCGYGERSTVDHNSTCEKHLQALLHLSFVNKCFQSQRHRFQRKPVARAALMDGDVEERLPQLRTFLSNPCVKSLHFATNWFHLQAIVLIAAAVVGLFPEKERAALPSRQNTSVLPRPPRPQSTRQCQILSNQHRQKLKRCNIRCLGNFWYFLKPTVTHLTQRLVGVWKENASSPCSNFPYYL